MRVWIILLALVIVASWTAGPSQAQQGPSGRGFSDLLCLAEEVGFEIGNGEVSVDIVELGVNLEGNREAEVTITHGSSGNSSNTSSTHIVEYEDDGDLHLDCGDVIISVT